jgi:RsiW-degrading membrane proteinase PrsW (M82 family)
VKRLHRATANLTPIGSAGLQRPACGNGKASMMNQPPMMNSPGAYAPTVMVVKPSTNRRVLKWLIGLIALLFALLIGLLVLGLIAGELTERGGAAGPIAFLVGITFAMLPVPIYIMLILWIDRYESEPIWMLATAFLWGATVAVFAAYILNTINHVIAASMWGHDVGEFISAVISAPVVEESAKGLILFIFFFWKKDEFDGILDGIVYAGMVGLGFAMTENVQYYGKAALQGGIEGTLILFIIRGGMAAFSHPLFTSMTGIGLGWARQSNSKAIKVIAPVIGFGLAMLLHATWNFSASLSPIIFFLTYGAVMIPIFVLALVSIIFAWRREGRVVREYLLPDLQRGIFSQEEYNRLCSVRGRMGASFRALRSGGFGIWRARMEYNQMASELAFHRSRVARGFSSSQQSAAEREAAYLQLLQDLRQRLGPH